MRAIRTKLGLTQYEMSQRLGVTRKTLIGWEASDGDIDKGVALQVAEIAGRIRVTRKFWVDALDSGSYAVVGERVISNGMRIDSATILYGVFDRRDQAYRWSASLQSTANTRITRKLQRERIAEYGIDVPLDSVEGAPA